MSSRVQHFREAKRQLGLLHPRQGRPREPLGLLRAATPEQVGALPSLWTRVSEKEDPAALFGQEPFVALYREKGGSAKTGVLKRHNHLSPSLALFSGEGEEWGYDIVEWIKTL